MQVKFGSIVTALILAFIVKISYETATSQNSAKAASLDERSPASIDKSYQDHLARR